MGIEHARITGIGLAFILIFLSGTRLTRSGKPYNGILFTAHKLFALAAAALLVAAVVQVNKVAPLSAIELLVIGAAALLFALTVTTGGLVSIEKAMPAIVTTLHRVAPFLTTLVTATAMVALLRR